MNRAILVKSCQKNRERQIACRNTWGMPLAIGTFQRDGIDVWIVEGGHFDNGMYADMGLCEAGVQKLGVGKIRVDCGDTYECNSIKVGKALKVMLAAPIYFTHLFICDDDTFVHPARWLAHEPEGDFECLLDEEHPWAHGGAGWWMSRRMCELYVHDVTQRCSWDDKLATEVAEAHGIRIVNRPDLYADSRYGDSQEQVSAENSLITCHPVQPEEMLTLWEATKEL